MNEDAKTHFEDTLNEDEFPPEDVLIREDTFRRRINEDEFPPEDELPRKDTFRRHIQRGQETHPAPGAFLLRYFGTSSGLNDKRFNFIRNVE